MIDEGGVPHQHPAALECRHAVANQFDGVVRYRRPDRLAHLPQEFPSRCWSARQVQSDSEVVLSNLRHLSSVASDGQSREWFLGIRTRPANRVLSRAGLTYSRPERRCSLACRAKWFERSSSVGLVIENDGSVSTESYFDRRL